MEQTRVDLKKEQRKTQELNEKLFICNANQEDSASFNITCKFETTFNNREYFCETQDITINHKNMKLNKVIGNHLRFKSNHQVTELVISNSSGRILVQ